MFRIQKLHSNVQLCTVLSEIMRNSSKYLFLIRIQFLQKTISCFVMYLQFFIPRSFESIFINDLHYNYSLYSKIDLF